MPGHTFLYSPPVVAIRELIDSGELGDLYFISTSRVNLGLHQADVSVTWDLGPHDFSILHYWLGEAPSYVSALSRGFIMPSIADVAFINLEYSIGHDRARRAVVARPEQASPDDDRRLGEDGRLRRHQHRAGPGLRLRRRASRIRRRSASTGSPTAPATSSRRASMRPSRSRSSCATSASRSAPARLRARQLRSGLDVVRMIEAVDQSRELSGARVSVDEFDPMLALKHRHVRQLSVWLPVRLKDSACAADETFMRQIPWATIVLYVAGAVVTSAVVLFAAALSS